MGIWLKGDGMVGWGFGLVDLSQIEGKREQKDGCWLVIRRRFDAALHCTYNIYIYLCRSGTTLCWCKLVGEEIVSRYTIPSAVMYSQLFCPIAPLYLVGLSMSFFRRLFPTARLFPALAELLSLSGNDRICFVILINHFSLYFSLFQTGPLVKSFVWPHTQHSYTACTS